jgi:hypothetical protein
MGNMPGHQAEVQCQVPMGMAPADSECGQSSNPFAFEPQSIVAVGHHAQLKTGGMAEFIRVVSSREGSRADRGTRWTEELVPSTPDRTVLFQVFRI